MTKLFVFVLYVSGVMFKRWWIAIKEEPRILYRTAKRIWGLRHIIINKVFLPTLVIVPSTLLFISISGLLFATELSGIFWMPLAFGIVISAFAIMCLLGGLVLVYLVRLIRLLANHISQLVHPIEIDKESKEEEIINSYRWFLRGTYWIFFFFTTLAILEQRIGSRMENTVNSVPIPSSFFDYLFEDTILSAVRPIAIRMQNLAQIEILVIFILFFIPSILYATGVRRYLVVRQPDIDNIDSDTKAIFISFGILSSVIWLIIVFNIF